LPDGRLEITRGQGPLVATAIHAGHEIREELAGCMAISSADRLREEDPLTDRFTEAAPTRVIASHSRFEVDLNRPREAAVYMTPQDSWGLRVWQTQPDPAAVERSLAGHDRAYAALHQLYSELAAQHGKLVVLDIHSYNHRRGGPDVPPADSLTHPQVNVGTGTMDRERWAPVVDRFIQDMHAYDFPGGRLDVRENVIFKGGYHARWTHESFPRSACVLAVEFKKFFMDEWTGKADADLLDAITDALRSTMSGLLEELAGL